MNLEQHNTALNLQRGMDLPTANLFARCLRSDWEAVGEFAVASMTNESMHAAQDFIEEIIVGPEKTRRALSAKTPMERILSGR